MFYWTKCFHMLYGGRGETDSPKWHPNKFCPICRTLQLDFHICLFQDSQHCKFFCTTGNKPPRVCHFISGVVSWNTCIYFQRIFNIGSYLLLVTFIIILTITAMNLLISKAISDIKELNESADLLAFTNTVIFIEECNAVLGKSILWEHTFLLKILNGNFNWTYIVVAPTSSIIHHLTQWSVGIFSMSYIIPTQNSNLFLISLGLLIRHILHNYFLLLDLSYSNFSHREYINIH